MKGWKNLGFLLKSGRIYAFPSPQTAPVDYQIILEVIRFDGRLEGEVWLTASWSVLGENLQEPLTVKRSSIQEPTGGSAYEDLVAAESRFLAKLSREIAEVIISNEEDPTR